MVTHFSIPAWRTPWTEEPGGLQSMGSKRARHDWVTNTMSLCHVWFTHSSADGHSDCFHGLKVEVKVLVAQSCLTLCDPMAPLPMGFSIQEHWSGLPFPSPGDLPNPGVEPGSPTLQADSLLSEPQGSRFPWLGCCACWNLQGPGGWASLR